MTEEDEEFLQSYNQKRPSSGQLSEDDFERVMEVFEDTAYIKAPFASIDQTIVPYDEMLQGLTDLESPKLMAHAKEIYEYWKQRRQDSANKTLHPTLKFETHQDSDDMDPYVCFRRREVRQTRKTRARDVQSADKLKRLRKELEQGRELAQAAHAREVLKADMLKIDKAIFDSRVWLKEQKIRLGIKTDDDDLINSKVSSPASFAYLLAHANPAQPQKRKPVEPPVQRPPTMRLPVNVNRPAEADLNLLADKLARHQEELLLDIEKKVQNHTEWNKNHVDLTRTPLSPVKGQTVDPSFRPAKTQYLMTPPASISNESLEEPTAMDLDKPSLEPIFKFRGVSHDDASSLNPPPAYRRRIGRLGRLWVDRRGLPGSTGLASPPRDGSDVMSDRFKYDQDSDDEDQPMYEVDPFDTRALRFRGSVPLPASLMNRGKPMPPTLDTSSHRPALPPPQIHPPPPQPAAQARPSSG